MRVDITQFQLAGYYPYNPLKSHSMELNRELKGCTPWIEAQVPGSVYDDLLRAGLIEDPYFNMNSLRCEWVPARWWVYAAYFDAPVGEFTDLVLEGVCTKAYIFLNGEALGTHENSFTPFISEVSAKLLPKGNFLKIVLESAPDEMGQVGYTDRTFTQRSRFDYKWDFGVRMIAMGLYRPVYLRTRGAVKIEKTHFRYNGTCALLDVKTSKGARIEASLSYEGKPVWQSSQQGSEASFEIAIDEPKLWYPNGLGAQPLYDLAVRVYVDGLLSDERESRAGLKNLTLESADGAPEDARPYIFRVNGKRMFLKGVNMVPLDMRYGSVRRADYERILRQAKDMNVNIVRVWGGGLIESEDFYDLCDELGLLVWQDFIQSSSGIDNFPSHRPEFLALLRESSEAATLEKRNHVSLAAFCGGNELMYSSYTPVNETVPNIGTLAEICKRNCPEIPFFPTTPSGHVFSPDFKDAARNHDVHGQWTYLGVEEHYRYFNELECLLHSEFGVDGMTNYSAIERTMPENLRYVCDYDTDMYWRHRGEWWNAYGRDVGIFGRIDSLKAQVELSQFLQAEGLRYAVDSHRRKAFRPSGCLIWQLNEPFPNGSCTNLIDYFGKPKLAYYAVKNSFAADTAGFRYDSLVYGANESVNVGFYAVTESESVEIVLRAHDGVKSVFEKKYTVAEPGARLLEELSLPMGGAYLYLEAVVSSQSGLSIARCLLLARGKDGTCDQTVIPQFNALLREEKSFFE